jgi:hypothetical protein
MNESLFQVICITFAIGPSVNSYAASLISVFELTIAVTGKGAHYKKHTIPIAMFLRISELYVMYILFMTHAEKNNPQTVVQQNKATATTVLLYAGYI